MINPISTFEYLVVPYLPIERDPPEQPASVLSKLMLKIAGMLEALLCYHSWAHAETHPWAAAQDGIKGQIDEKIRTRFYIIAVLLIGCVVTSKIFNYLQREISYTKLPNNSFIIELFKFLKLSDVNSLARLNKKLQ